MRKKTQSFGIIFHVLFNQRIVTRKNKSFQVARKKQLTLACDPVVTGENVCREKNIYQCDKAMETHIFFNTDTITFQWEKAKHTF